MVDFFVGMRLNNNAAWFEEHRSQFERTVKKPMSALVESLEPVAREIDPQLDCRPAHALARIRRDTRFSNNKEPYRDHLWFVLRRVGERSPDNPGFYFGISASEANWGCGFYVVPKPVMDALRAVYLRTPSKVLDVIEDPVFASRFAVNGEAYKKLRVPDPLDERLRFLWMKKDLYTEHTQRPLGIVFSPELAQTLADDMRILAPFYRLLRDAADTAGGIEAEKIASPLY